jgi:hypothetical protein
VAGLAFLLFIPWRVRNALVDQTDPLESPGRRFANFVAHTKHLP